MIVAIAPPRCALYAFSLKLHVPRWTSAIVPVSEPAGTGLASPAREHPSDGFVTAVLTLSIGTMSAGPTTLVAAGPKAALPNGKFFRFAGTGSGAVTLIEPAKSAASLVTAPTPITFGEIAGELTVAVFGPAFPFAKTATTPASTASSAAWTIGSGQASVFWYDAPHEFEMTSAPSLTASS